MDNAENKTESARGIANPKAQDQQALWSLYFESDSIGGVKLQVGRLHVGTLVVVCRHCGKHVRGRSVRGAITHHDDGMVEISGACWCRGCVALSPFYLRLRDERGRLWLLLFINDVGWRSGYVRLEQGHHKGKGRRSLPRLNLVSLALTGRLNDWAWRWTGPAIFASVCVAFWMGS
ncbi:hypothetical protein RM531_08225 [Salinisphaera sp. P385]|uniref:Uncharacterized protein n=1 Tax=Spectribacter acetivorans TaxID=3075603 RepID=A0ABU3B7M4_9GAMM|nr:hypothetical protein [Salinisphaera sp. P385]MDT0618461.1 hypothetical protein [Salinisphaera sp. P385]